MNVLGIVVGSFLLAACAGPRPPGAADVGVGVGVPPVSPDDVEAARAPEVGRLVTRRNADIMLYPAEEAAALKRQRDTLQREFATQPKLDAGVPR